MKKQMVQLICVLLCLGTLVACGQNAASGDATPAAGKATGGGNATATASPNAEIPEHIQRRYDFALETLDLLWAGDTAALDRLAGEDTLRADTGEAVNARTHVFGSSRGMFEAIFGDPELHAIWKTVCDGNEVVFTSGQLHAELLTYTSDESYLQMWARISDVDAWCQRDAITHHGVGTNFAAMSNADLMAGFDPAHKRVNSLELYVFEDQNGDFKMAIDNTYVDAMCGVTNMYRMGFENDSYRMNETTARMVDGYTQIEFSALGHPDAAELGEIVDLLNAGQVVPALRAHLALREKNGENVDNEKRYLAAYDGLSAAEQAAIDGVLARTTSASALALRGGDGDLVHITVETLLPHAHANLYMRRMPEGTRYYQALLELEGTMGLRLEDNYVTHAYTFFAGSQVDESLFYVWAALGGLLSEY